MDTKNTLQNEKVNVKIILSALWVAVVFIYVYADIKTLFQSHYSFPDYLVCVEMANTRKMN